MKSDKHPCIDWNQSLMLVEKIQLEKNAIARGKMKRRKTLQPVIEMTIGYRLVYMNRSLIIR